MDTQSLVRALDELRTFLETDNTVQDAINAIADPAAKNKVLGARMDFSNRVDALINANLVRHATAFTALEPMIREGIKIVHEKAQHLQAAADAIAVAAATAGLAATLAPLLA